MNKKIIVAPSRADAQYEARLRGLRPEDCVHVAYLDIERVLEGRRFNREDVIYTDLATVPPRLLTVIEHQIQTMDYERAGREYYERAARE